MFENPQQVPPPSTPPPAQNPLNPVMPNPGMTPMGSMPPSAPTPVQPAQPQVHAMPERFRATGGKTPGSKGTKGLVIALIVVVVIAILTAVGLYFFNSVLTKNNSNLANANTVVVNTANENTNTIINSLDNANTNTSLDNTNTLNTNTDLNTNSALNTNVSVNTNTTTNTNTSVSSDPLPSSTDTDADGLTDVEEVAYGTSVSNPDSDADGFIDGKQVKSDSTIVGELVLGYNPKGTGTLEASTIVKRVTNGTKAYSILIPVTWTTTVDSSGGILVTPTGGTAEFFKLGVTDNPTRLTAKDWYQQANPSADVTALKNVAVNGLSGIVSEDGSTVYLTKDDKVYSLNYGTGSLSQVNYWTTFDMIQRSFKLGS